MTAAEAQAKWSDACAALVTGGAVWLNGNREPIAITLSKHIDAQIEETDLKSPRSDWKAVILVTPNGTDAAFYLCVE